MTNPFDPDREVIRATGRSNMTRSHCRIHGTTPCVSTCSGRIKEEEVGSFSNKDPNRPRNMRDRRDRKRAEAEARVEAKVESEKEAEGESEDE